MIIAPRATINVRARVRLDAADALPPGADKKAAPGNIDSNRPRRALEPDAATLCARPDAVNPAGRRRCRLNKL
jgi:hypothetical protein